MGGIEKRLHILYSGHVQGVGFRFTAEALARKFKVSGYAKNLSRGGVEVVAEGEESGLKGLLDGIDEAMKRYIKDKQVSWEDPTGEFKGFGIHDEY
jgi:acylphosphatase